MRKVFVLVLALGVIAASPAYGHNHKPEHPGYWENVYPGATCYKHTGSNAHGSNNGTSVTLNAYQETWFGDRWEVLIVKGGSEESTQNGLGYVVYELPVDGVAYDAPLGTNNKVKDVSHWIVCKGTTPTPEPTPTPTPTPTPSPTPTPTPTPSPSPSPEPPLECPEGYVPGWLDENGNPTSCVSDNPTPQPDPEPDTPKLADTGFDQWFLAFIGVAFIAISALIVIGADDD